MPSIVSNLGLRRLQKGSSLFGVVTSTLNNPREVQFAATVALLSDDA